jgi:hypothetical protein
MKNHIKLWNSLKTVNKSCFPAKTNKNNIKIRKPKQIPHFWLKDIKPG